MEQVILDHLHFDSRLAENQNVNRSNDHCSFGTIDPMYNISGIRALWKGFPNFIWKNENELVSGSSGYYQKNGLFVFSVGDEKIIFINNDRSFEEADILRDLGFDYPDLVSSIEKDLLCPIKYYYFNDRSLFSLKKGLLNGRMRLWDDEGNIFADINFKNGEKDGLWKFYDSDGRIKVKGRYNKGVKKGSWEY